MHIRRLSRRSLVGPKCYACPSPLFCACQDAPHIAASGHLHDSFSESESRLLSQLTRNPTPGKRQLELNRPLRMAYHSKNVAHERIGCRRESFVPQSTTHAVSEAGDGATSRRFVFDCGLQISFLVMHTKFGGFSLLRPPFPA